MHKNYTPFVQCLSMRQSARLTHIEDKEVLRTGDRAHVKMKFLYRPEYIKPGMRLIFREGACKGIGIVSQVGADAVAPLRVRGNVKTKPESLISSPAAGIKVSQ